MRLREIIVSLREKKEHIISFSELKFVILLRNLSGYEMLSVCIFIKIQYECDYGLIILFNFKGKEKVILPLGLKVDQKFNPNQVQNPSAQGERLDWTRWVLMTNVYRCASGFHDTKLRKNDSNASLNGFPALMSGFMCTEALFEGHYCFPNEHLE